MTKKSIIRMVLLAILISSAIIFTIPYKEFILDVFNAKGEIPIYSVDAPGKQVAITFDCAWGGDDIPQIIALLNKYNVKATFFLVGSWMDKYADNVKALSKAGHDVANHSDTHPDLTGLSEDKIKAEIQGANQKIESLTGNKNILFRAPYGAYNDKVVVTAKSLGQYVIQWDVDSLDWKDLGVQAMVDRVMEKAKSGSILLFHNDTKYTIQALPVIIERLKAQGYSFSKVSDMIIKQNYYVDHQGRQYDLIKEKASLD